MSSQDSSKSPSSQQAEHLDRSDCAIEAAQLLNCVASKKYSKEECVALLDSLRACVKKNRVVDFTLLPDKDSEAPSKATAKKPQ